MCRRRPPEQVAEEMAVVTGFAKALAAGDLRRAGQFLADDGEFMVNSKRGEDRPVGKRAYLIWLSRQYSRFRKDNPAGELTWAADRCFDCLIGKPVILFSDGTFPVKNRLSWETRKTGLAMEVENGKITVCLLCSSFMLADNPYIRPDPIDPHAFLEEPGVSN